MRQLLDNKCTIAVIGIAVSIFEFIINYFVLI